MPKLLLVGALALSVLTGGGCSGRRPPGAPDLPPSRSEQGLASWYGIEEAGRATASGEPMDPERLTAAHRSLPFGSLVRVVDLETGRRVEVIINDRGPFVRGRIIDLSYGAARNLGIVEAGVARVRIDVIGLRGPLAERRFRVQLGSFTDEAAARRLANTVQAEGHTPVTISPFEKDGSVFYRVWVGEFRERDGAERLRRALHTSGHIGFVLLAAASER